MTEAIEIPAERPPRKAVWTAWPAGRVPESFTPTNYASTGGGTADIPF